MKKILFIIILLLCANTVLAIEANSVTQYGITWTFDKTYEVGQFANGDYWVKPDSPAGTVTVVNIDPPSVDVNGDILHGSMINPQAKDVNPDFGNGLHVFQGFDGRLYNYSSEHNKARPGGADLSAANPLVIPDGSSLVSSISNLETPNWGTKNMALNTVLVLTVVTDAPPSGSFRPAYAGEDKTVKYNISDIDYSVLGAMKLVGVNIGNLTGNLPEDAAQNATFERMVERPWLDFGLDTGGYMMHPEKNMALDGAVVSNQVGQIALILNSSDYTNAEKEKLLIGFIQVGIDNYGVHDEVNTVFNTWNANGQIGSGRKFPILFAGKVLNNPLADEMLNIGNVSIDAVGRGGPGYVSFAEDEQTFYVTAHPDSDTDEQKRQIWLNGTDQDYDIFVPNPDDINQSYRLHEQARGGEYYGHANPGKGMDYDEYLAGSYVAGQEFEPGAGHEGMPEWGIVHPYRKDYDGLDWNASYRLTNGRVWGGWVLAAHIMGLQEHWGHDALFDYMDRYMRIQKEQRPDWVRSMWETYRYRGDKGATQKYYFLIFLS